MILLRNPWFQLCLIVAVLSGGTIVLNLNPEWLASNNSPAPAPGPSTNPPSSSVTKPSPGAALPPANSAQRLPPKSRVPAAPRNIDPSTQGKIAPPISFSNTPLKIVIGLLAKDAHTNVVFHSKLWLNSKGRPTAGPEVDFTVENVTPMQALNAVLKANDLVLIADPEANVGMICSQDTPLPRPAPKSPAASNPKPPGKVLSREALLVWRCVLILPATLLVCLLLSHPTELRRWRKRKIVLTLVVAGALCVWWSDVSTSDFRADEERYYGSLVSFWGLLAGVIAVLFLWAPNVAHVISLLAGSIMESPEAEELTKPLDLRPAHLAIQREAYAEALELVKEQLKTHGDDFEACVLAAKLHYNLGDVSAAKKTLKKVLRLPDLIEGHRQLARDLMAEIDRCPSPGVAQDLVPERHR